jgi:hypothetical protein
MAIVMTGSRIAVRLLNDRRIRPRWKLAQYRLDPITHILRRRLDVAVEVEGRDDEGSPLARDRPQLLDPSTVLTTSSIGLASCDSASSGEAPGRVIRIVTVGRSIVGNRSTPSLE